MATGAKVKTKIEQPADSDTVSFLAPTAVKPANLNSTSTSRLSTSNQDGDPQLALDGNGDLAWSYTLQCIETWSPSVLLDHLNGNLFSIPARGYTPQAPFVNVRRMNGEVIALPHPYRLPLMFVGKYLWETLLGSLKDENADGLAWKAKQANVLHLSRLCQTLFAHAQAKAGEIDGGGMEKGWRCVVFDRLLVRFYKQWPANDSKSGLEFLALYGKKEYDRDALKYGASIILFLSPFLTSFLHQIGNDAVSEA